MTPQKEWYIRIGIAALIVIGIAALLYRHPVHFQSPIVFLPQSQQFTNPQREQQLESNEDAYALSNIKEVSGGTVATAMSYHDASIFYKGRVLQLNENCRAIPVIMTVPQKSVVMVANDSQWQRLVIVGSRVYTILPYDYILSFLTAAGQYNITCDSVQNVAIISVQ